MASFTERELTLPVPPSHPGSIGFPGRTGPGRPGWKGDIPSALHMSDAAVGSPLTEKPMTPMEQLFYSTVRLVTYSNGVETGSGTGFFWGISDSNAHVILIATTKHLLKRAEQVR